jgi:hypothetical protein
MTVLPTVRSQLCVAAERLAQDPPAASGRSSVFARGARRRPGRTPLIAIAIAMLLLGGAFGGGLILLGKPSPGHQEFSNPTAELGALTPGTVRLLPVRTPDPAGGPDWGMRVLSTTRGVGCIQVGRLVDGRLGALGQDNSFNDDGRFHELPATGRFNTFSCVALDGQGRIFNNVTQGELPASAAFGVGPSCEPPGAKHFPGVSYGPNCPQADERNLYYGLLGPEARAVTYVLNGKSHTVRTVGADGAYLIVTRAPLHQLLGFAGATAADVVPVDGPITELHFTGNRTCHLNGKSWIGGTSACTPPLEVPVGYAPVAPPPSAAAVAAPLQVRIIHDPRRGEELLVSFNSRVPINTDRSDYQLRLYPPGVPHSRYTGGAPFNSNIAAGRRVTLRTGAPGGHLRPGLYTGDVTFVYATGPALLEGPGTVYRHVGSFSIRVP